MWVLNWVPYGTQDYELYRISKAPYGFSGYRMALLLKQPFVALVDHVRLLRNPYGPARAVTGVHKPGYSMGYLHVFWLRVCEIPYVFLTGSVRFTCGYPGGLCGFHSIMGTSYSGSQEPYGPEWMPRGIGKTHTISAANPYWVLWGPRVHAPVLFTKPNTIMCTVWNP